MRKFAILALAIACASLTGAQAVVPVFTQFTPTIFRVAIGGSNCTAWSQLPAPWPVIVYCVGPDGDIMVPASASQTFGWDWVSADGHFSGLAHPSTTQSAPALDWQMAATPTGGVPMRFSGSF